MSATEKSVKISGYLEKKGKMKMMSSWKKHWFVLESRLLLYYHSRDEYEAISPCKGTVTLGPQCKVKPCSSINFAFQIQTISNTITLRAENEVEQKKWMEAILFALSQKPSSPTKLSHFRYSLDDMAPITTQNSRQHLSRQHTMPERGKLPNPKEKNKIVERLQHIGAQTYGGSLNSIIKATHKSPKLSKNQNVSRKLLNTSTHSLYATIESHSPKFLNKERPASTVLIENDQYVTTEPKKYSDSMDNIIFLRGKNQEHIYERISGNSNQSNTSKISTLIVDNENYTTIEKRCSSQSSSQSRKSISAENIYAVPSLDHNKNSLMVENEQYVSCSTRQTNGNVESEALYEDPDIIFQKCSIMSKREEETTSQCSSGEQKHKKKTLRLKKFTDKLKRSDKSKNGDSKTLKSSSNFMKKMLRKKTKKDVEEESGIYEDVEHVSGKLEPTNDDKIQMLSELQKILTSRKSELEMIAQETAEKEKIKEETVAEIEKPIDSLKDKNLQPCLPPRQKNKPSSHDVPKRLQNDRNFKNFEAGKLKTIDEILDDLDREKQEQESNPKVKHLIKQFSGTLSDDEVILRRSTSTVKVEESRRHSDELYQLLDELCKVTSAPVLTPGATNSLITPNLTDEEWLKLLPIRKRRFSDPDYDVPRPHRSLQIQPRVENPDNVIPATRFFGPVLTNTATEEENENAVNEPSWISMTPDSLEPTVKIDENPTAISYNSHNYVNTIKPVTTVDEFVIYSQPKPIITNYNETRLKGLFGSGKQMELNDQVLSKNQDIFIDSLEPYTEVSTAF